MTAHADRVVLQARAVRRAVAAHPSSVDGAPRAPVAALVEPGVTPIDELGDRLGDHAALMAAVRHHLDRRGPVVPQPAPPATALARATDELLAARAGLELVVALDDELRAALGRAVRLVAALAEPDDG